MKKIYMLSVLLVVGFYGCGPSYSTNNKPHFALREIFSTNGKIFINCHTVEYEVNGTTLKKVPLSMHEQLRIALRDSSDARLSIQRQMYNSESLYNSKRELVKNYFVRDRYPFIGAVDENGKVQNDNHLIDKVLFAHDSDRKFLETCYSLRNNIVIENKAYPIFERFTTQGCGYNIKMEHYVAWWNEKVDKLVLSELNDFFKNYMGIDRDMYQYLPVLGIDSRISTRILVNSNGIYKVNWDYSKKLSYTYVPFDNSKKSVHFTKLIDRDAP